MPSNGAGVPKRPSAILLAEVGAAMVIASVAIRIAPVRTLGSWMGRQQPDRLASAEEIATLVRAIRAWSRRLPWRTMCFEEGLSAHWLLRRRRLASTLHYGAARIDGQLEAHVWVRSGNTDVTGCETAARYALLARFPDS